MDTKNLITIGLILAVLSLTISCGSRNVQSNKKRQTFTGEYRSVKGIKDNLSCFCYNAGYLTLDDGSAISICFKDEETDLNCKSLQVSGIFDIYEVKPDDRNPCPSGKKEILTVSQYKCLD